MASELNQATSNKIPHLSTKRKKELKIENRKKTLKDIARSWELYVFLLPAFLYFLIFHYVPLYGVLIAFKDFNPALGVWDSPWVGFMWFEDFFSSYYFWDLIKNTIGISLYSLVIGFPMPIILALAFNEVKDGMYKRGLQTITYAPHFISLVVMVGMIIAFLSPQTGLINHILGLFGVEPIDFMQDPGWFKTVFVLSGVWQGMGWDGEPLSISLHCLVLIPSCMNLPKLTVLQDCNGFGILTFRHCFQPLLFCLS